MKKSIVITSALMSCFLLTACGSQSSSSSKQSNSHSSNKAVAKTSTSKKQSVASSSSSASQTQKYTDEEYAMMGFLKLDGQGVDSLLNNTDNMHWTNSGNKYAIDFGAHTTTMTVEKNSVEVTYDDIDESTHAMGMQNAHKTYTKEELANQFGTDKAKIDQVLGHNSSSSSSTQDQSLTQQASSVLYYGANKLNNQEFKNCYDFAVKNSKLAVSKTTNDQGTTIYKLAPGEVDSYIGYSVDSGGTIHFYKMTPGDSGEIGSASKKDISSYVSSQNASDQVNQLANAATTYGN
ncbi:hypothetical protein [Limosilactobacillus mucosae]|uniref:hypothetical protein n=1 Tax=Limosilactobacillus mucosae TaxID=97478 RepID=UPI0022E45F55|nr:hypothetical protein [Limosilactobacillus mucosae]